MKESAKLSCWLLGAAGLILIITAAFHAGGYRPLLQQLSTSNIQSAWLAGMKGLWLIYSLHLVIIGVVFLTASIRSRYSSRTVLFIIGLVPACDTLVLLLYVGIFIGTLLLALTTVLVFAALALQPGIERQ